jgi:hypothetical protein
MDGLSQGLFVKHDERQLPRYEGEWREEDGGSESPDSEDGADKYVAE